MTTLFGCERQQELSPSLNPYHDSAKSRTIDRTLEGEDYWFVRYRQEDGSAIGQGGCCFVGSDPYGVDK